MLVYSIPLIFFIKYYFNQIFNCLHDSVYIYIYKFNYMYFHLFLDSNLYAHFVFKAFDVKSNGAISFKVSFV